MKKNQTGKYLKYAIGEIILVVIGILIALSINNWNEKQKEKKQIRNIYARIVQDFNNTAFEIESEVGKMDKNRLLMRNIIQGNVVRDSLLTNLDYCNKYFRTTTGYPDIKINDKGVQLLESKIELDYELNTELTGALTLLYSEFLFEIEVDAEYLDDNFRQLTNYIIEKGIRVDYVVNKNRDTFINMIFEDDAFKNYFFRYVLSYGKYKNMLKKFKTDGKVLIDKIKTEYNLE